MMKIRFAVKLAVSGLMKSCDVVEGSDRYLYDFYKLYDENFVIL